MMKSLWGKWKGTMTKENKNSKQNFPILDQKILLLLQMQTFKTTLRIEEALNHNSSYKRGTVVFSDHSNTLVGAILFVTVIYEL